MHCAVGAGRGCLVQHACTRPSVNAGNHAAVCLVCPMQGNSVTERHCGASYYGKTLLDFYTCWSFWKVREELRSCFIRKSQTLTGTAIPSKLSSPRRTCDGDSPSGVGEGVALPGPLGAAVAVLPVAAAACAAVVGAAVSPDGPGAEGVTVFPPAAAVAPSMTGAGAALSPDGAAAAVGAGDFPPATLCATEAGIALSAAGPAAAVGGAELLGAPAGRCATGVGIGTSAAGPAAFAVAADAAVVGAAAPALPVPAAAAAAPRPAAVPPAAAALAAGDRPAVSGAGAASSRPGAGAAAAVGPAAFGETRSAAGMAAAAALGLGPAAAPVAPMPAVTPPIEILSDKHMSNIVKLPTDTCTYSHQLQVATCNWSCVLEALSTAMWSKARE